jgi:hypothetical protein
MSEHPKILFQIDIDCTIKNRDLMIVMFMLFGGEGKIHRQGDGIMSLLS